MAFTLFFKAFTTNVVSICNIIRIQYLDRKKASNLHYNHYSTDHNIFYQGPIMALVFIQ